MTDTLNQEIDRVTGEASSYAPTCRVVNAEIVKHIIRQHQVTPVCASPQGDQSGEITIRSDLSMNITAGKHNMLLLDGISQVIEALKTSQQKAPYSRFARYAHG